jgi:hypothetical protein
MISGENTVNHYVLIQDLDGNMESRKKCEGRKHFNLYVQFIVLVIKRYPRGTYKNPP